MHKANSSRALSEKEKKSQSIRQRIFSGLFSIQMICSSNIWLVQGEIGFQFLTCCCARKWSPMGQTHYEWSIAIKKEQQQGKQMKQQWAELCLERKHMFPSFIVSICSCQKEWNNETVIRIESLHPHPSYAYFCSPCRFRQCVLYVYFHFGYNHLTSLFSLRKKWDRERSSWGRDSE